jgi:chromosome segregation ATPase
MSKKIALVKIKNFMGIDELEFAPDGKLTEITGKNGKGKTSILEAIKSITGASDATLLRKGADKGEVVLVLDDGMELITKVTAAGSSKSVMQDGKKVPKPTDVIRSLTDLLSVNPVEFLTARKQDRVTVLLESMPIELDLAKLSAAAGTEITAQAGVHPLALIELVRKQVFEDRTGTNRAVKEKDATINQMSLALPDVPEGVTGNEAELADQLEEARAKAAAENERITTKIDGIRKERQAEIDKLRADAQEAIDKIKADAQAAIADVQAALADFEGKAARQKELTKERFAATAGPINQTLTAMKVNRDAFARREQTQAIIEQMKVELVDLERDVAAQTQAIAKIDAYKAELVNNLPIPGLEVIDGEVTRNGIVFDRLNTAQQVDIAIEIAKLRAGELAIACIDNFEMLDPEAFEEFKARAEESNLQLFVTRVTGDEFNIS